jgi:hypothetical protein
MLRCLTHVGAGSERCGEYAIWMIVLPIIMKVPIRVTRFGAIQMGRKCTT